MIKIEVGAAKTKEVIKKSTGEVFNIPEVDCYAYLQGEKYPHACKLPVGKGKKAPEPGVYYISDSAFYVGKFQRLEIRAQVDLLTAEQAREVLSRQLAELGPAVAPARKLA